MPLSHELRPLEVLQSTMDYLIFNISSEIPSSKMELARWYDFLWSRTRAIRKVFLKFKFIIIYLGYYTTNASK